MSMDGNFQNFLNLKYAYGKKYLRNPNLQYRKLNCNIRNEFAITEMKLEIVQLYQFTLLKTDPPPTG